MSFKSLWFSEEEKSVRGSFIQLIITVMYLGLIITGSFASWVAGNLRELESLLIGFYLVSFGVWTGKKSIEFIKKSGLDTVLGKHGLNMGDLPLAGETVRAYRQTDVSAIKVNGKQEAMKEYREAGTTKIEAADAARVDETVEIDPASEQRAKEREAAK